MTPNPNARTKLYLNIRSHLRDSGLKFFERARERQFLLLMRSDALTLHQLITIHKDGIKFRIETKLPLVVPAHRRVAVLELAARLNCITDRGHFDVNVDTGDMQYRVDCDALVSLVVRPALLSVLARSLEPVVRAWPLIEEVMLHDVDPKTVMEKFRKKVQDRAGENARNAAIARRRAERERDRNPGQPGHGSPMNFDIDLSILDGIELPPAPEFLPGMEVPLGKEFLQGIEDAIEEALDDAIDELDAEQDAPKTKDRGAKGRAAKDVDAKDAGSKDVGSNDPSSKDAGSKGAGSTDASSKDLGAKDVGDKDSGTNTGASTGTNASDIEAKDAAGPVGDLPPGNDPKRKSRNIDPDRKSVRERFDLRPRVKGQIPSTPPSPPTPPAPTPPPGPDEG